MATIKAFITKHEVLTYFALVFTISWGGLLLVGGLEGLSGTAWQSDPRLPFMVVAMLAGPSIAGLFLTGVVSGRAGIQELLSRLLRWRVGARWYAVALLTAPLVFAAVHLALSLASPVFVPRVLSTGSVGPQLVSAIAGAILVGLFEEIGWTGFATPSVRLRHGVFATGLIVGIPWGAWHLLTNDVWIGNAYAGDLSVPVFVTANGLSLVAGQLPAYRVLIVWVYDRTGSVLVAMLMHASLSACTFLVSLSATGFAFLIDVFVFAAVWWIVVAVVVATSGGQLVRQALRRRAA